MAILRFFTNRSHVSYIAEYRHEHGHPPTGYGRRYGLDEPGYLHREIVKVVSTDQQADAGEKFTDDWYQHAWFSFVIPIAPRSDEYYQHRRYTTLHDRFPYYHIGH